MACACLIPIATDIARKLILARDMTNLFSFIQMEFLMKQEMNEPYMQHYVNILPTRTSFFISSAGKSENAQGFKVKLFE